MHTRYMYAASCSADVPLSPSPQFSVTNRFSVQVEWDAPFAWKEFPIINYRVEVTNMTSREILASSMLSPDTFSFSHHHTNVEPLPCTNLSFAVYANSTIGESSPGITYGAFPTGKIGTRFLL